MLAPGSSSPAGWSGCQPKRWSRWWPSAASTWCYRLRTRPRRPDRCATTSPWPTMHGVPVLVRIGRASRPGPTGARQGARDRRPARRDRRNRRPAGPSVHYPPFGRRGFATYPRAGHFGLVEPACSSAADARLTTLVFGMIESPAGVSGRSGHFAVPGHRRHHDRHRRPGAPRGLTEDPSVAEPGHVGQHRAGRVPPLPDGCRHSVPIGLSRRAFADGADLVVYNLAPRSDGPPRRPPRRPTRAPLLAPSDQPCPTPASPLTHSLLPARTSCRACANACRVRQWVDLGGTWLWTRGFRWRCRRVAWGGRRTGRIPT